MSASSRHYPDRPVVGVGAVVIDDAGHVVLVRRGSPPLEGTWSLPGGAVEVGESLTAAVAREVLEETGLVVEVVAQVAVFEHISKDDDGRVRFHYVLVDYVCRERAGCLEAGTDAAEVARVDPSDLARYNVTEQARTVIGRACALVAGLAG